jgi:hypothetical protein
MLSSGKFLYEISQHLFELFFIFLVEIFAVCNRAYDKVIRIVDMLEQLSLEIRDTLNRYILQESVYNGIDDNYLMLYRER